VLGPARHALALVLTAGVVEPQLPLRREHVGEREEHGAAPVAQRGRVDEHEVERAVEVDIVPRVRATVGTLARLQWRDATRN